MKNFIARPAVLSTIIYTIIAALAVLVLLAAWSLQYVCHNHFAPLILGNNDPVAAATYCRRS